MDKGLLQLQSGKEKFTTEQLKENLESVLQGLAQTEPEENVNIQTIKEQNLREDELTKAIQMKTQKQKRKKNEDHYGFRLVGKTILHRWIGDGEEKWYTGKILRAIGDIRDEDCGFEIKYNDGDEQVVQLYKEPEKDVVYLDG